MKILATLPVILLVGMLLMKPVYVSAQGKDSRGGVIDEQMKKLHAIMPMFSVTSAELESALEKGDSVAAKAHAGKILAAVPDLKKSRPHKNSKQRKKFVDIASNFEATVTSAIDLINKDDLSGAKIAFKKIEGLCVACHAKFRD
jgi:cytochrome c556